jgi:hypothetical protein
VIEIVVARDFTTAPGARFRSHGEYSGEDFRERFLDPHFAGQTEDSVLLIRLDSVAGYAPSFLDEAFGGLARKYGADLVESRLQFVSSDDPDLVQEILKYIRAASDYPRKP